MTSNGYGEIITNAFLDFLPLFTRYINPIIHHDKSVRFNMNENKIKVLMVVDHLDSATPTQINHALQIQKGSLTTMIRSLIDDGLLEKSADDYDMRQYHLAVTQLGKSYIAKRQKQIVEQFGMLFQKIPKADMQKICSGFDALTSYLKQVEA